MWTNSTEGYRVRAERTLKPGPFYRAVFLCHGSYSGYMKPLYYMAVDPCCTAVTLVMLFQCLTMTLLYLGCKNKQMEFSYSNPNSACSSPLIEISVGNSKGQSLQAYFYPQAFLALAMPAAHQLNVALKWNLFCRESYSWFGNPFIVTL